MTSLHINWHFLIFTMKSSWVQILLLHCNYWIIQKNKNKIKMMVCNLLEILVWKKRTFPFMRWDLHTILQYSVCGNLIDIKVTFNQRIIVGRYIYLQGSSLALLIIDNTFLCFMDLFSYILHIHINCPISWTKSMWNFS